MAAETHVAQAQAFLDGTLRRAARWASLEVIEELIQRGCRPVPKLVLDLVKRPDPITALKVIKLLGDKHGVDVAAKVVDQSGACPLSLAARKGHLEMCRYLIEKGADVNRGDQNNETPLFWAASYHHAEVCQLLLDSGADNNHIDKFGYSPFWWAVHKGHLNVMEILLRDRSVDMQATNGWTPLFRATASSAQWLIARGAQVNHVDNVRKQTAIFFAVERNDMELVKVLLRHGADINFKDQYQQTCLFYAVNLGHTEMTKLLVEMKADILLKDLGGRTATDFARKNGALPRAESAIRYVEAMAEPFEDKQKKRRGRPGQASPKKAAGPAAAGRRSNPPRASTTRKRNERPASQPAQGSKRKDSQEDDKGPRKRYRFVQAETNSKLTSKQKKLLLQHCPFLAR
ncbi:kidins220b [Symbiodinium natans]|uniref:Kidins220b protein n=1 Tax=Symbiodinium natans TaxID=878477 RepID=A0A812KGN0_9DINO|nr:kidins220b [Symbiodinium natans]